MKRGASELNLLIGVDKPAGCTSHDVVARVRRALSERRVGHAGTLDPLATGVMVVGVGCATRLLGMLTLDTKRYVAQIAFGAETSTDDAEGEVTRLVAPARELSDPARARTALAGLLGAREQVPPAYSAISVDGVRSYRRARAGEAVELAARPIEVFEAELLGIEQREGAPVWTVALTVSKGTYIRALARDLGRELGSAAHLAGLRRTASGCVEIGSCVALDEIAPSRALERALDPVRALGLRRIDLAPERLDDVLCGRRISTRAIAMQGAPLAAGERVALVIGGELRAIAEERAGALAMKQVYPQGIGGVRA